MKAGSAKASILQGTTQSGGVGTLLSPPTNYLTGSAIQSAPSLSPVPTTTQINQSSSSLYVANYGGAQTQVIKRITGIQNVDNRYGQIPRIYGKIRVKPVLAAQTVTIPEGNDSVFLALLLFGHGPLHIEDIRIGGKPIASITGAQYEILPGDDPANEKITLYTQKITDLKPTASLTYNKPVSKLATAAGVRLSVEIAFPNGLWSADSTGLKSATTAEFNVDYALSGATGTTVNATSDPVAGNSVVIDMASTAAAQVGQWVTVSGGGHSEMAEITSISTNVSITVSSLAHSYATPTVQFGVWQRVPPDNGLSTDPTFTITDNSNAVVKRVKTWTVTNGTYVVRVTRLTADSTSTTLQNTSQWSLFRIYGDSPEANPVKDSNGNIRPMAYVALKIPSSSTNGGTLQQVDALCTSKLATWDGSQWTAPVATQSPAWIYADELTGTANPQPRDKSTLNGNGLKAWADFCTTQGFTYNDVLEGGDTLFSALQKVCTAGRGGTFQCDGLFSAIIDQKQTTVVQHFSPLNAWGYNSEQNFNDLPHALRLQFLNENNSYQQDERIVYADGYNADGSNGLTAATDFETIPLAGVTNPDQVWKLGRFMLAIATLRRRTITFYTDVEQLACTRFDLIHFSHDALSVGLAYAWIESVQTDGSGNVTGVTVNGTMPMTSGSTYGVRIKPAAGGTIHQQINTVDGGAKALTFTTAIASNATYKPSVGDQLTFGLFDKETIELIVSAIEYQPDLSARITCFDHAPAVYNADTGAIPAFTTGSTVVLPQQRTVAPPVILGVATDESVLLRDIDGSYQSRIQLTMQTPAAEVSYYEMQYKPHDASDTSYSAAQIIPVANGVIYVSPVTDGATYDIRVKNITYDSFVSDWTYQLGVNVIGKQTPPPDIQRFDAISNSLGLVRLDGITLPLDYAGIRYKWAYNDTRNWDLGNTLIDLTTHTQIDLSSLPAGLITIMAKLVDVAGNESTNAAYLVIDFGDVPVNNVVVTVQHDPDFSIGAITNGSVVAGVLSATEDGAAAWSSTPATTPAWSTNGSDPYWTPNAEQMDYQWDLKVSDVFKGCQTYFDLTQQSEAFQLLYRHKGSTKPAWNTGPNAASSPYWSSTPSTTPAWDSPDPFADFPGSITLDVDTYTFKAITSPSKYTEGKISKLAQIIDAFDVSERIDDFVVSASGSRLPITKTYNKITNVQLTLQQDSVNYPAARAVMLKDKLTIGPLIYVLDSSDNPVSGIIDAYVQGY